MIKVYLVFKISVVSVVSEELIFHAVLNSSVVSVVSDKIILDPAFKIILVSVMKLCVIR